MSIYFLRVMLRYSAALDRVLVASIAKRLTLSGKPLAIGGEVFATWCEQRRRVLRLPYRELRRTSERSRLASSRS